MYMSGRHSYIEDMSAEHTCQQGVWSWCVGVCACVCVCEGGGGIKSVSECAYTRISECVYKCERASVSACVRQV